MDVWGTMLLIVIFALVYYDWGFKNGFKKGRKEAQSSVTKVCDK